MAAVSGAFAPIVSPPCLQRLSDRQRSQHGRHSADIQKGLRNLFGDALQDNSCDCGLFLLTYMDFFTHSLPAAISAANLDQQHGAALCKESRVRCRQPAPVLLVGRVAVFAQTSRCFMLLQTSTATQAS